MAYLTRVPQIADLILNVLLGSNLDSPLEMTIKQYLYLSVYSSHPGWDKLTDGLTW